MKKLILLPLFVFLAFSSYAQNELKPEIKEIYYIDKEGERIEGEVSPDEGFVYLVIVSANIKGKEVKITLEEGEYFLYKKQFLSEGSTVQIEIKDDYEKVKFIIYNPTKKKHYKRRMEMEGGAPAEDAQG